MKNLPTPREKSLDQADLEEDDAWPGNSWVNLAIPTRVFLKIGGTPQFIS